MASHQVAVFGILPNPIQATRAVDSLVLAGFKQAGISVLMTDRQGSTDFAHEKHTKAPEGTTTGAAAGGTIGGTLGLLAGIGALALPGIGPLVAAGPIMSALAGLGVGGALGGLVGGLIGLGIPEYEARGDEGGVRDGGVLLSVHCDSPDEVASATEILARGGGTDVASANEETASSMSARSRVGY